MYICTRPDTDCFCSYRLSFATDKIVEEPAAAPDFVEMDIANTDEPDRLAMLFSVRSIGFLYSINVLNAAMGVEKKLPFPDRVFYADGKMDVVTPEQLIYAMALKQRCFKHDPYFDMLRLLSDDMHCDELMLSGAVFLYLNESISAFFHDPCAFFITGDGIMLKNKTAPRLSSAERLQRLLHACFVASGISDAYLCDRAELNKLFSEARELHLGYAAFVRKAFCDREAYDMFCDKASLYFSMLFR